MLLGTSKGLFRLSEAGVAPVVSTATTAVDGEWAIVEEAEVVSLDSGVTATTSPFTATCVTTFGDGALVGTAEAHLFSVDD